jgi:SAM-dependent methyltransferase
VTLTPAHPVGPAARWGADLMAWAVPDELVAAAGRSPWGHPVGRFAARADADVADPGGMSLHWARDALERVRVRSGAAGTVLDVGAGAGAASLPLARWAAQIVAVDRSAEMLAAFAERAERSGTAYRTVTGAWPQVAATGAAGPAADVVVCHHVLYDVPDVAPFLAALTAAARDRVVVEVTAVHPMSWLSPLWLRFHGLVRPERPTAADLPAVLHELGVRAVSVERWQRPEHDRSPLAERVALVTRRLCLPPDREAEVRAAIGEVPEPEHRAVVTLTWAGSAGAGPRSVP